MSRSEQRIAPLSEMTDFKVARGDPDPRGWDVIAADGRKVGTVRDLLADREERRVRYLEVELAGSGRRTLLPIGTALLDDATDRVLFQALSPEELDRMPEYDYATFTKEYEHSVITRFGPGGGGAVGTWGYSGRQFDEDAFFARRRNRYGGMARGERLDDRLTRSEEVVLSRRVVQPGEESLAEGAAAAQPVREVPVAPPVTQPVTPPVTQPAVRPPGKRARRQNKSAPGGAASSSASASEAATGTTPPASAAGVRETAEEIVVPIVEEQLVVERRPVVKEELVIRKKRSQTTKTVEVDLKRERVEVQKRDADGGRTRDVTDDRDMR
jgi:photosynthetic reaction center H subunit